MGRDKNRKRATPVTQQRPASFGNSILWVVILLLCLAGVGTLLASVCNPPSEATHSSFITGFILLGFAAGLLAVVRGWFDIPPKDSPASQKIFYGIALSVGLFIGLFIYWFGMRQFGGFDHSVLVDVGWRLVQGQKAHVDFPCTLPVGFFLGAKYAFQLFGISWRALILFTVIFSLVLYVWSLWLLVRLFRDYRLALLLAVTSQCLSQLLVSYWWYNPITSATAVVFMLSAALWWHRSQDIAARGSYFFALFLMATMKPNVAGIIVPLVSVVFLVSARHRYPVLILSGAAFAAFMLLLWVNQVNLALLLKGYLTVAQRGMSLKQFLQDLGPTERELSLVALAIALLPAAISIFMARSLFFVRCPWIALAGILASLNGFLSNGELKLVDLPGILMGSILLAAELNKKPLGQSGRVIDLSLGWRRYATWICILLAFAGVAQGFTRHRVKGIGYGAFFEYQLAPNAFPDGFFKGLRGGRIFWETNEQITDVLRKTQNASVAFGPRMQWAYAAFNKPSPLNQPIWWHPGVSFAASDEGIYISRFLESRYDLIILLKNDATYFSENFIQSLVQHYTVDQSYSHITVLRHTKT